MAARSVSFDDDSDEELYVFSGNDLLIAHYDVADLSRQHLVGHGRGSVRSRTALYG